MSELPINKAQALRACKWLKDNFGEEIRAAMPAPFTLDHACAIACQETAYFWLQFIDRLSPSEVLARCVLDGSGDVEGTSRRAFPRNTAAFIAKYGKDFADMLVIEGNKTRALRGMKSWGKLYKGYGIFQYDLQFVLEDEAFFFLKKWHDIRAVVDRLCRELRVTYARHQNIPEAIRAYNGSGPRARQYRDNVLQFLEWSKTV